jgi:hypothetical protein
VLRFVSVRMVPTSVLILACCVAAFSALAQQQARGWRINESGGEIRVNFDNGAAQPDDGPLLTLACDKLNATVNGLYRTRASSLIQKAQSGTLALRATGAGNKVTLPAYLTRAPGEEAIGFEAPLTLEVATVLGARDLVLELPDLRITADASGVQAMSQLISACPEAPTDVASDKDQYRPYLNAAAGFGVDIPMRLFRLTAADRNGRNYQSEFGRTSIDILIFTNALEEDVGAAFNRAIADPTIVAAPNYKHKGKSFFVISGKNGKRIVYYKALLTCDGSVWVSLRLEYNETSEESLDPIVTRMSHSLTPRTAADGTTLCQ